MTLNLYDMNTPMLWNPTATKIGGWLIKVRNIK